MKNLKILTVFLFSLIIITPCFAFIGCVPMFEKAICKVGKIKYNSLAEAISVCEEGGLIEVFNDVMESLDNQIFENQNFVIGQNGQQTFTSYNIDKAITIRGIKQNRKIPKIYGSFICNLTQSNHTNLSINIDNLEIINNHVSYRDNTLNKPFINGISIESGNVVIKNCTIHPYKQADNSILEENNISCLKGISLARKNVEALNSTTFDYTFENNKIFDYSSNTSTDSGTAFSLYKNKEGYTSLEPFKINNSFKDYMLDAITQLNEIKINNATNLQIFDFFDQKFEYLKTNNINYVKDYNFKERSTMIFTGENFGFEEKTTFNVYGALSFINVKNVHFEIKTSSGKFNISGKKENVTWTIYNPN